MVGGSATEMIFRRRDHSRLFRKDGLQCRCFYHTQDFFFVIKGAGAGQVVQKWVSSYPASWHMSHFHFLVWPITLSGIHPLNSPLFFLQNDDGPDVRAGSGDILLVHATETERKGTVWRHLRSLCVFFFFFYSVLMGFEATGTVVIQQQYFHIPKQTCHV